jgi:hypothetical protein
MDGKRLQQRMHSMCAPLSRRNGIRLFVTAMLGLDAAAGPWSGPGQDAAAGKKHHRHCKRRKKRCKRHDRLECQACRASAPPPPPDWTDTPEKWVDEYCGIACLSLCGLIWCWSF